MGVVKSITCSNGRVTAASGGTVDTADVSADAITFAKMQNISTSRLLGRGTAGSGDVEELTLGAGFSISGGALTYSGGGSGTVTSVGFTAPTYLSVTGSPVTTSGTLALSWAVPTASLLGRTTAGTGAAEAVAVAGNLSLSGGVLTGTTSTEEVQDIVGAMVSAASWTVQFSYDDGAGTLAAEVRTQHSITSDASGIKLDGDAATPGASKYYGTDSGGSKGWHSLTSGGTVTSVGLSLPSFLTVSGSPVTSSGTLTATLASQSANTFLAAPGGAGGTPTFRQILYSDIEVTGGYLLGRGSAGTGPMQAIAVGSGLQISGGQLETTGGGSVTSVDLTAPAIFSVSGGPVTSSGTLALSLATQTANRIWAGPSSGADAAPTFRAMVSDDLPALGVTSSHLASNAVTTAKITDANVTTTKIADAAITTPKIADGNVTLAKLPIFASARLIGYDGVSTTAQNLSIGSGLAISGTTLTATTTATVSSVGLSLPSMFSVSGTPVTTSGTLTATLATQSANTFLAGPQTGAAAAPTFRAISSNDLAANLVLDSNLRQSAGLSVIGRSANTTGDVADITAASDHQVLRRSGTSIGFGSVALASANAVTGTLPAGNGGTGLASYTTGDLVYASGASALSKLAIGTSSQVLGVSGGVPAWRDEYGATNGESVLGSAYTVSSSSFADTGLSVTLPAAGTYLVLAECRGTVVMASGTGGVVVELYNTTDAAAIVNTERIATFGGGTSQATTPIMQVVTVAGSKTIRINARRVGSGTFTSSTMESNTAGRSVIRYIRLY